MRKLLLTVLLIIPVLTSAANKNASIFYVDMTDQKTIVEYNSETVRPMASITKLMTAMVSIDCDPDLSKEVYHKRQLGSKLPSKYYTRYELLHALLIRSDNGVAETLANDYPGGKQAFIRAMNIRALLTDMQNTHFDDPSGLSSGNKSTAYDIFLMVNEAEKYPEISKVSTKRNALIETPHKKNIRKIQLNNTNHALLYEFNNVLISKTGFTNPAGYCVAMMIQSWRDGKYHKDVVVVLGTRSSKERHTLVKNMLNNIHGMRKT